MNIVMLWKDRLILKTKKKANLCIVGIFSEISENHNTGVAMVYPKLDFITSR